MREPITKKIINEEVCYNKKIELIIPALLNYIRKRVVNYHDCKDILQEVLVILFIKKSQYDSKKNFYSWAFTISSFQIKKYLVNKKRSKEENSNFCGDSIKYKAYVKSHAPSSDSKDLVNFCIFNNKKLFTSREFQVLGLLAKDYKCVEISKELNINSSHVSNYKKRAFNKIKNFLELLGNDYEKVK